MNLNVEIPDDLAQRLSASGGDLSRRALEAFAVEEYKAGRVTKAELRRLLGFDTRYELDGFLKAHDVWMNYTIDDLRREVATLQRLGI
jgi:predicted HTH domain antitoxin